MTRTEFLIVRHARDAWKTTNTGRLAAMAMPNATLRDHGLPHQAIAPPPDLSGTWLLFPDDSAVKPSGRPRRVVVPDGTWPQARRMVQRIPWLRALPRLSLAPTAPFVGLRRSPNRFSMSTLAAIARAVEHLEGPGPAALLDGLHDEFVQRIRSLRGGPASPERTAR